MKFKVYILESLRENDLKTGNIMKSSLEGEDIFNEYFQIDSVQAFTDAMKSIAQDISIHNLVPVIHFDCHADDEGIAIVQSVGAEIRLDWEEIRTELREVYSLSSRKSILCMSCCEGFYISRMVAHNKPCPFDHACGSFLEIGFQDSHDIFFELYKLMKSGDSVFDASVNVSNRPEFSHMKFVGLDAPTMFRIAINGYFERELTPEKISERKALIITEIKAKSGFVNHVQQSYLDQAFTPEGQKSILEEKASIFFS